jgi:DNA (cytosine-5)-methyltransferase 1
MSEVINFLYNLCNKNTTLLGPSNEILQNIGNKSAKEFLDEILTHSESSKGVLTVILTSLVYKMFHKEQDIRYHQANMKNGYSGRSFDSANITPFLKQNNFPAMAESGWLTRSLEQNRPYDKDYPGKITPPKLKEAFLSIIDIIQIGKSNEELLNYILQFLILQRNNNIIQLARPTNLSINDVIVKLNQHFTSSYSSSGAARLPVLAIQAVYDCLVNELIRYKDKKLLQLEEHTSADIRSGRIGDIEVANGDNTAFEACEIKLGIEITKQLVSDVYNKINHTQVERYYILSTAGIKDSEKNDIYKEILRIKNIHGCQVIVNGVLKTLEYYLRLLSNAKDFINNYVELLEKENSIKFEHKKEWNNIINESPEFKKQVQRKPDKVF